jgi:hypothetical protein
MVPVVYNYHCACGYHYADQEQVQVGAYIRLLINSVVLCPECKEWLHPEVHVTYATLPTNESAVREQREESVG